MNCVNHPDRQSDARCAGCQETFCSDCLVEVLGDKYCGSCKVMALDLSKPPLPDDAETIPCKLAGEALTYAIVGFFCFGFILGPIAYVKGSAAKKEIDEDPRLSGRGKATAAQVIGVAVTILSILFVFTRIAALSNS